MFYNDSFLPFWWLCFFLVIIFCFFLFLKINLSYSKCCVEFFKLELQYKNNKNKIKNGDEKKDIEKDFLELMETKERLFYRLFPLAFKQKIFNLNLKLMKALIYKSELK